MVQRTKGIETSRVEAKTISKTVKVGKGESALRVTQEEALELSSPMVGVSEGLVFGKVKKTVELTMLPNGDVRMVRPEEGFMMIIPKAEVLLVAEELADMVGDMVKGGMFDEEDDDDFRGVF